MNRLGLLTLLLLPCYSLSQTKYVEKYVEMINNCDLAPVNIASENCVFLTNGEKSDSIGREGLICQIRDVYSLLKNPKLSISDKLGNSDQEMANWSLKDGDSIINRGSMTIKLNGDSIESISLFYDYTEPTISNENVIINEKNATMAIVDLKTDKYWFYVKTSQGGFYSKKGIYISQILKCSQAVSTPGYFTKDNAIGPFDTYNEASTARRDECDFASKTSMELIPATAICETKWK